MKSLLRHGLLGLALLSVVVPSFALNLARVFGDHMVLQAGEPVPVWGWGRPGESVTVRFGAQEKRAVAAAADGRWQVVLDPLAVSAEPAVLTIAGAETVTCSDVLVGEVWLCSGQSNMAKPLGEAGRQKPTTNHVEELRNANFPLIRLFQLQRSQQNAPAADVGAVGNPGDKPGRAAWTVCSPASLDGLKFSAVGYFFGRKLHQELNVPVGLINASVGGTRIEPWIPPAGFAGVPALAEFAQACRTPGARVEEADLCTLYNGMIAPLVPFALRGVLWYQGESNIYAGGVSNYADKMTALINGWRGAWRHELPFYYVQVAPLLYHVTRTDYVVSPEVAPELWEAQTATLRLPRTGMVVTTDLVEDLTDIHPPEKRAVGERLARWALAGDYGRRDLEVSGPLFRRLEIQGARAILHFDHVGGGLVVKGDRPLNWFVIAGADGKFFPGKAAIEGSTVVVTSARVPAPRVVRFAWDEAARPNFFNSAGLPAVPFRTDNPFTPPAPAR
jgi:sialate O-acetylesterase